MPDLNLPVGDMLPEGYVQSEAVRLEIYGRAARCRSDDDLEDLEEETSRRFGKLPPEARDVVALMAFSATTSTALAAGLLLLAHLSHAAGR